MAWRCILAHVVVGPRGGSPLSVSRPAAICYGAAGAPSRGPRRVGLARFDRTHRRAKRGALYTLFNGDPMPWSEVKFLNCISNWQRHTSTGSPTHCSGTALADATTVKRVSIYLSTVHRGPRPTVRGCGNSQQYGRLRLMAVILWIFFCAIACPSAHGRTRLCPCAVDSSHRFRAV